MGHEVLTLSRKVDECKTLDEGDDADYNLYSKVAGCTKSRTDGGCTQRRCSKDNMHDKVCDKHNTGDAGSCSLDACGARCTDHTDFVCTHWAEAYTRSLLSSTSAVSDTKIQTKHPLIPPDTH